ncbi:MAG: FAD-binding oxidoreductase [Chloroflexota bacterium]
MSPITLNDAQSALNATLVARVEHPRDPDEVSRVVRAAADDKIPISIAGARHSMGGQQFGTDTVHLDMRGMDRILGLDQERGIVDTEAGASWSTLIDALLERQSGLSRQWGIRQKQTGADVLTIGGAIASNVHGRGLTQAPIVADVESLTLVDAQGEVRMVDRVADPRLFSLVVGGYGLFGVVTSVRLRLAPRKILRRHVSVIDIEDLSEAFEERIASGYTFGDCQYSVDEGSGDFMRQGILSCYRPEEGGTSVPEHQRVLSLDDWKRLLYLTHVDRAEAARAYLAHYSATSGQLYWSDLHQRSEYIGGYHTALDRVLGAAVPASEVITEIYVPRSALAAFMRAAAKLLRPAETPVVYGTIRLVQRDTETVLAWAREPWACIILNLHTTHDAAGQRAASAAFRSLIDLALEHSGSYYLTYHRFALRDQAETSHPRIREFLSAKLRHDPDERFQSDWYRHLRTMFLAQ